MITGTLAKNLALGAVSVLISLILAELICRTLVDPAPITREEQVRYEVYPIRGYVLRKCQSNVFSGSEAVTIDCDGFRAHGSNSEDQPSSRILALGDSFTFGLGVGDDDTWPARLQRSLTNRLGVSVRVDNAGTIGYGVFQELDLLKELLQRSSYDVVIHGLYWNDYQNAKPIGGDGETLLAEDGHFVWNESEIHRGRAFALASRLYGSSSLATVVWRAVKSRRGPSTQQTSSYAREYQRLVEGKLDPEVLQPVEKFYTELSLLQERHGFSVFVVLFPVSGLLESVEFQQNPFYLGLVEVLERFGFSYINGFDLWENKQLAQRHFLNVEMDAHLNSKGYEVIAEALSDRVIEDLSGDPDPLRKPDL